MMEEKSLQIAQKAHELLELMQEKSELHVDEYVLAIALTEFRDRVKFREI